MSNGINDPRPHSVVEPVQLSLDDAFQFREETRYPGFYYHMDYNYIDDVNWKCFVNSNYDRNTKKWSLKKVPYVQLIK